MEFRNNDRSKWQELLDTVANAREHQFLERTAEMAHLLEEWMRKFPGANPQEMANYALGCMQSFHPDWDLNDKLNELTIMMTVLHECEWIHGSATGILHLRTTYMRVSTVNA